MSQQTIASAVKKVSLNKAGLKVARNTAKVRHRSGLTQKQFAEATDLSVSTISRIEQNHYNHTPHNPMFSTVVKLSNSFEVSVESVISDNL